jgi:hypothetical protein
MQGFSVALDVIDEGEAFFHAGSAVERRVQSHGPEFRPHFGQKAHPAHIQAEQRHARAKGRPSHGQKGAVPSEYEDKLGSVEGPGRKDEAGPVVYVPVGDNTASGAPGGDFLSQIMGLGPVPDDQDDTARGWRHGASCRRKERIIQARRDLKKIDESGGSPLKIATPSADNAGERE